MFLTLLGAALAQEGPTVTPGAEVRIDLVGARLDRLQPGVDEDPSLGFQQTRGFMWLKADLPPRFSALVRVDVNQSSATTVWPGGQRVPTYPDTFRVRMMDAWLGADLGRAGQLRVGMQFVMFGDVDTFIGTQHLYVPGTPQFQDAIRQAGLLPNRTLGVRWDRSFNDHVLLSLQVANGVGHTQLETELNKTASARLWLRDLGPVGLRFSALAGPGQGESTRVLFSSMVDLDIGHAHGKAEVFYGQGLGARELGGQALYGHDLLADRQAGWLDRLNLVGRAQFFDADLDSDLDRRWTLTGAANLYMATEPGKGRPPVVMFGLSHEVLIPQDVDAAIEHEAVLEARVEF